MDKKGQDGIARRSFMGAAMLGIGGAAGWAVSKLRKTPGDPVKQVSTVPRTPPGKAYDIDKYRYVDPKLLTYEPDGEFQTGLKRVKDITCASDGRLLVAGDKEVRSFDASGQQVGTMGMSQNPHCVHISASNELFVGLARHFQVHAEGGELLERTEQFSERSFITGLTTIGDRVYVADAGNKEVLICDRKGSVEKSFGGVPDGQVNRPNDDDGDQGFAVPSPYFAVRSNAQGDLWVTNPGHLRVESYSQEGEYQSSWGNNGMQIEDFTGCCNPVHLALLPGGGFVTSEKGLFRIKTYDLAGEMQGVVAGAKLLVPDERVAKEARSMNKGVSFALAVNDEGRIFVLDPFRKSVRAFRPLA